MHEVVERLRAVAAALPPSDGIAAFTALYLAVTEEVDETAKAGTFADPRFLRWLDVVFANLYFDTLRAFAGGGEAPRAWSALFEARGRPGILPLQFALAGM